MNPYPGGMGKNEQRLQTELEVNKVQDSTRQDVLKRLNYIAGHLEGIRRMVEEDKYCPDVLKQTFAVRRAIEKMEVIGDGLGMGDTAGADGTGLSPDDGGHDGLRLAVHAWPLGEPQRARHDDVPHGPRQRP